MPCYPGHWWSSGHSCLLGLTLLLLVCEIVTSRLCNSLISMVDSFHTLFVFLRLSFLYLPPHQPPTMFPPSPSLSSNPTSPNGPSSRPPVSLNPAPSMTSSPVSSVYPSGPVSAPSPPSSPVFSSAPSPSCPYGWARVRPLGALVSALLLASLCVSASVDIVSEALWPHPTEHPLLVTAVGAVGLLFNVAVLIMEMLGLKRGVTCPQAPTMGTVFTRPDAKGSDTAEAPVRENSAAGNAKDRSFTTRSSSTVGRTLQNKALMFCNPGASSVLDPDHHSQGDPLPPLGTITTSHTYVPWCRPKMGFPGCGTLGRAHCGGCHHSNRHDEAPEDGGRTGLGDSHAGTVVGPEVPGGTERPSLTGRSLPGPIALVQALLGSVLVLANGLVLLQTDPGCPHSMGACRLLVYLDPGFSALAVVLFLATALPQACRHGYLLLQGTPSHFSLEELSNCITGVPGVLALHELHMWQLTEAHLVASVHVHCHAGLGPQAYSDLLRGVTEVLWKAGVRYSTVQPEFLSVSLAGTASSLLAENPLLPALPGCSLACGKECALKMCCSPRDEEPRVLPSAGKLEDLQSPGIIIENTYL